MIDANDTLLFFRDDSVTQTEYSRGRVARIRLYDRPLSAPEVLGLACAELRISIDPRMCQGPAG